MENIDLVQYGRLIAEVETLKEKVEGMDKDIKQLLALANQSKGGFWAGMAIASGIGGFLTWLAQHWVIK